jgi:hypothetical protein
LTKEWRHFESFRKSYKATVRSADPVASTHSFFGLKAKQFTYTPLRNRSSSMSSSLITKESGFD